MTPCVGRCRVCNNSYLVGYHADRDLCPICEREEVKTITNNCSIEVELILEGQIQTAEFVTVVT